MIYQISFPVILLYLQYRVQTLNLVMPISSILFQANSFLFMKKLKQTKAVETAPNSERKTVKIDVSCAWKRVLEAERIKAVEAYRKFKAAKHQHDSENI